MSINDKITHAIAQGTVSFFSTMIGAEVTPGEPREGGGMAFSPGVSATLGMSGDADGSMAIHLPTKVAENIIEAWLGERLPADTQDARDAVGEITNIVLGDAKTTMSAGDIDINLSIPNVIAGTEFQFTYPANVTVQTVPFTSPYGDFVVDVAVRTV